MRFVIAPDWLVEMPEDAVLNSKTVLSLYGYAIFKSYSCSALIKAGHIPEPDKCTQQGKRRLLGWTVGRLLDRMKRPEEIRYK
mgnify:CR=1 FL=1